MKNLSGKTLIFYTYQNRCPDNHSKSEYNVTTFKKSSPQQPKIRDVLFELPINYDNGSYHFRFKSQFLEGDQKITGWIDISNLLSKVPMIANNIYVKVLRIPEDHNNKLFTYQKLRAIGLIDPLGGRKAPNSIQSNGKKIETPSKSNTQSKVSVNNKLNGYQNSHKKVSQKNNQNLFDFQEGKQKNQQNPKDDKLSGLKKIVLEQTTQQKLKNYQDSFNQQEQNKEHERQAAINLDQKLIKWGYCGTKSINNVTTLLATLHILWPAWPQVSLSDMLKPEEVQIKFKKAKFMLHPDKNRNKDPQTKYLAKRIFQLLNDAKNTHK